MEDLVMELCELFIFRERKLDQRWNISSLELAEKELGEV